MKTRKKIKILLSIIVFLCLLNVYFENTKKDIDSLPDINMIDLYTAKEFKISDLDNTKPTLVIHFSVGCEDCENQMKKVKNNKILNETNLILISNNSPVDMHKFTNSFIDRTKSKSFLLHDDKFEFSKYFRTGFSVPYPYFI